MNVKSFFFRVGQNIIMSSVVVILLTISNHQINAQDTVTGAFEGRVVNQQTGKPLKAVSVRIINEITKVNYKVLTDEKGRFYQGLLTPGIYIIQMSTRGYQTTRLRRTLKVSSTTEIVPTPIMLKPIKGFKAKR